MTSVRSRAVSQIFLFFLLISTAAIAQNTINVPADQPTIQAAINAAQNGDTVLVAPGTYSENINFVGKAVTVTSSGGRTVTTIDGHQAGTVVTFGTNEGQNSVLSGFTITNGKASFGGGGIEINSASPIIENNTITQNQACGSGNGIEARFSAAIIRNNTISNNLPAGCSGGSGGGVSIGGAGSVQLLNNLITGNGLPNGGDGGGVGLNAAGTPTISGNIIQANTVYNDGGGLSLVNASNALVVQNLITGNRATSPGSQGGGVYVVVPFGQQGPVFVNNTIAGNNASQGSAVYVSYFFQDTRFFNNLMIGSGGIEAFYCSNAGQSTPPVLQYNDAFSSGAAGFAGVCASSTGSNGNVSSDPLFVNPGQNDFHVAISSPAVDAGSNTAPNLPNLDLDGNLRVTDGNGDGVATVDLGVYESFPPTATLSPTSFDFGSQTITGQGPMTSFLLTAGRDIQITSVTTSSSDYIVGNQCPAALPANGTCTITVTFQPTALGVSTANLIVSGNFGSSLIATLSGNSQAAILSASVTSLNFGGQQLSTASAPQTVTLTNTGNSALQINSISASADYAQTNNCGSSLAPNSTCSLSITFTPSAIGDRSGQISLVTNSIGGISAIAVSGTGQAAVVSVSPSTGLSFGSQLLNTSSAAQAIAVSNSGNVPMQITAIATSGEFAQSNNCGSAVAPNSTCNVYVTFTPTATGKRTGSVTVNASAVGAPVTVALAGVGVYPTMSESPQSLTFGNQIVGSSSASQAVVVSNTGTAPLQITAIYTTGDFFQTSACSSPLAPGASCAIDVVFTPTARYARTGTLVISSSQSSQTDTVALSGTGTVAIAQLSPSSLNFGNQRVNTSSASQNVTLVNTGDGPLTLSSIFTAGPYSETNNCGSSIAPGTACNITVVFTPTARGTVNAVLSITGNQQGAAPVTALSGTGVGNGH